MKGYRKQEPPFTVKFTLSEGCNLYCSFCGLQGIREKSVPNYRFLTLEKLESIAVQIAALGWRSKIELTGKGEPTMNPQYVECVAMLRKHLPRNQIMMTSNGGGLLRKPGPVINLSNLFAQGLNVLVLDDYKDANIVPKVRRAIAENKAPELLEAIVLYEYDGAHGKSGNPYKRYPVSTKFVSFMQDLKETAASTTGIRSHMNNAAGAGGPPNTSMAGKRCARPFRELDIRWDGTVGLCCQDWRGAYKCGDIIKDGLEAVWQGAAMNAARRKLYHGQRDFSICNGCDSYSGKVGLLPDHLGAASLPKPNANDQEAIKQATAGKPYTVPVLRPWEKV